jgi:predicted small secreted protein
VSTASVGFKLQGAMMKKTVLSLLLMALAALSLSACNTVAGVGQDLKAGGQAITNAAEKAK